MAERIWSGPWLFAKYDGDREAAKRMERRARTCVGYLFGQLRPGQTYRVQSWNYNDGSRIKAHVWRDVLGERARVEIFVPDAPQSGIELEYMDSGFVLVGTTYGSMWQSGTTAALYGNYTTDPRLAIFGPKKPVDGGGTPPSFDPGDDLATEYAEKRDAIALQAPGSYTGKLRWLIAGQYGLKVGSDEWLTRDSFTRSSPCVRRRTGEGIYTADDGAYWYLRVEGAGAQAPYGTATRLETRRTAPRINTGAVDVVQRQYETHTLATAKKSDTVWPLEFTGDEIDPGVANNAATLGHGWQFDRNGRNAAVVLHDLQPTLGGPADDPWYIYYVTTRKYTATITPDTARQKFIVDITAGEAIDWWFPLYVTFWSPYVGYPDVERQVPRASNNQVDFDSFEVPLVSWYNDADELQDCVFSYEREEIDDDFGDCYPYILNGVSRTIGRIKPGGHRDHFKVTLGENEIAVFNGPVVNGTWDESLTYDTAPAHYEVQLADHVRQEIDWRGLLPPCPNSGNEEPWHWESTGFGAGCRITRIYDWEYLTNYTAKWTLFVNTGTKGAMSIVVPFDSADSLVVFTQDNTGSISQNVTRVSREDITPPGGSRSAETWKGSIKLKVEQVPGYPFACPDIGEYQSPTYVVSSAWAGTETADERMSEYTVVARRALFHKSACFFADDSVQTEKIRSLDATMYIGSEGEFTGRFWWLPDDPPASIMPPVYVSAGETGAIKWNDGIYTHLVNGYPPNAELVVGWA